MPVPELSAETLSVVANAAVALLLLTWRTVEQVEVEQLALAQARARALEGRLVRAVRPRAAPRSAARRPAARRRSGGLQSAGDGRGVPWHRKVRRDRGTS